jgi:probable addiction module antidote protein
MLPHTRGLSRKKWDFFKKELDFFVVYMLQYDSEDTKMEKVTVSDWNLADEIHTKEDVIGIIDAALQENDIEFLYKIIGDIARSKGMAQIARDLNLNRESLYHSLSEKGNPSFSTVVKVLDNLGLRLNVSEKIPA